MTGPLRIVFRSNHPPIYRKVSFWLLLLLVSLFWWKSLLDLPSSDPPTTLPLPDASSILSRQPSPRISFYSNFKIDRSGSVVQDLMLARAYSEAQGVPYRGACGTSPHQGTILQLLKDMQWQAIFPIQDKCPKDRSSIVLQFITYRRNADPAPKLLTRAYRQNLAQQTVWKPPLSIYSQKRQVVVHIRRGDVSACGICESCADRYLPNQHYLQLIQRYSQPGDEITIYTEQESLESWDNFRDYNVVFDKDIYTMWSHMATADVLILSKSSFSYVPALLNLRGQILYTPYWNEPMEDWTVVPQDILDATRVKNLELRESCPNYK